MQKNHPEANAGGRLTRGVQHYASARERLRVQLRDETPISKARNGNDQVNPKDIGYLALIYLLSSRNIRESGYRVLNYLSDKLLALLC